MLSVIRLERIYERIPVPDNVSELSLKELRRDMEEGKTPHRFTYYARLKDTEKLLRARFPFARRYTISGEWSTTWVAANFLMYIGTYQRYGSLNEMQAEKFREEILGVVKLENYIGIVFPLRAISQYLWGRGLDKH